MKTIAFRIRPDKDLKETLETVVNIHKIQAGNIITCVGSLQRIAVRMAGATKDSQNVRTFHGHFEIVSLVGTLSTHGSHIHLAFSDEEGSVLGGHLKSGTIVDTTVEIVIGIEESYVFDREPDEDTGFDELTIRADR